VDKGNFKCKKTKATIDGWKVSIESVAFSDTYFRNRKIDLFFKKFRLLKHSLSHEKISDSGDKMLVIRSKKLKKSNWIYKQVFCQYQNIKFFTRYIFL